MGQPHTFIFFGRSGCGKGTQAALLKEYLQTNDSGREVLTIETGKEIRKFIENYSAKGNHSALLVKEVIDRGGLLPEFIPVWIWTTYLVEHANGDEHWILDGLSRRPSEAPVLDGAFKFYKRERPFVILMDVSRRWSIERLLARGRYDDSEAEINKRLDWFDNQVVPTLKFFMDSPNYRFLRVNGEQAIEAVHAELIKKAFNP